MKKETKTFLLAWLMNRLILQAWYIAEYRQFGELQHGRHGDDLAALLYFLVIWALLRRCREKEAK